MWCKVLIEVTPIGVSKMEAAGETVKEKKAGLELLTKLIPIEHEINRLLLAGGKESEASNALK